MLNIFLTGPDFLAAHVCKTCVTGSNEVLLEFFLVRTVYGRCRLPNVSGYGRIIVDMLNADV